MAEASARNHGEEPQLRHQLTTDQLEEASASSIQNSALKESAGLKERFKQEDDEPSVDPLVYEKQKVFNLVLDTSSAVDAGEIKETSFESLN